MAEGETKSLMKKLEPYLWGAGIVVGLAVVAFLGLTVWTNRAVNAYRSATNEQINAAIDAKTSLTEPAVELASVPLGSLWRNYKRTDELQETYKSLLTAVQNYNAALMVQEDLVSQYNAGIDGDDPLNGDILKTINTYDSLMRSRFPDEAEVINRLADLQTAVMSSTNYSDISSDVGTLLLAQDAWLTGLRTDLESRISDFETEINI